MGGAIRIKAELLAAKERSYEEFVALVAVIGDSQTGNEVELVMAIVQEFFTDETLERSIPIAYPSRVEQEPIGNLMTAYVEHYVEHAAQIRAWRAA